jgi:Regulator of G protein signaling domain
MTILDSKVVGKEILVSGGTDRRISHKHTNFALERSIESYGLLDLYSYDAFHTVLHTPRIYDAFAEFLRFEHSSENLIFWSRCERYKEYHQELCTSISLIDHKHLPIGASEEINVSDRGRKDGILKVGNTLLALEETDQMFGNLQSEVEMTMWRDSYPRFLKHQSLAYNASRSLGWPGLGRMEFNGLGECFCLTDPQCVLAFR